MELAQNVDQPKDDRDRHKVALDDPGKHAVAVVDRLQRVLGAPKPAADPNQRESDQRTPPDEIGQDGARARADLRHKQKGKGHDGDVQQE